MSDLAAVSEYVFGERWQSSLSRSLDVSDRTVRRWVAGQPVPPGLMGRLYEMAAARQFEAALPVLESVFNKQQQLPEEIELFVGGAAHRRTWSDAADLAIKTHMAALMTAAGLKAKVVLKN